MQNERTSIANSLLRQLGSFWRDSFNGQAELQGLMRGVAVLETNITQALAGLAAVAQPETTPIYRHVGTGKIQLRQSTKLTTGVNQLRYSSSDARYGDPVFYGGLRGTLLTAYAAPSAVSHVGLLVNRLHEPTFSLSSGVDFFFEKETGSLVFRDDPFLRSDVAKRNVYRDGDIVDTELLLFGYELEYNDVSQVFEHFGYALPLPLAEADYFKPTFREFVSAVFAAFRDGPSEVGLRRIVSAIYDTPLFLAPNELIEEVVTISPTQKVVVTSAATYTVPIEASLRYGVGEAAAAYQFVDAGFDIKARLTAAELGTGSLLIDSDFLPPGFHSLGFPNRQVPLVVETVDGRSKVSFELIGRPADIEEFFAMTHAKGLATGQTLAMALDQRASKLPGEEPPIGSLPATVNPAELVLQHLWRFQVAALFIEASNAGPHALSIDTLAAIDRLQPPFSMLLLVANLAMDRERLDGNAITDQNEFSDAAESLADSVSASFLQDTLSFSYNEAIC